MLNPVELHALEKTIVFAGRKELINDPVWRKAFDIYNYNNESKISMERKVCYMKVLLYFKTV